MSLIYGLELLNLLHTPVVEGEDSSPSFPVEEGEGDFSFVRALTISMTGHRDIPEEEGGHSILPQGGTTARTVSTAKTLAEEDERGKEKILETGRGEKGPGTGDPEKKIGTLPASMKVSFPWQGRPDLSSGEDWPSGKGFPFNGLLPSSSFECEEMVSDSFVSKEGEEKENTSESVTVEGEETFKCIPPLDPHGSSLETDSLPKIIGERAVPSERPKPERSGGLDGEELPSPSTIPSKVESETVGEGKASSFLDFEPVKEPTIKTPFALYAQSRPMEGKGPFPHGVHTPLDRVLNEPGSSEGFLHNIKVSPLEDGGDISVSDKAISPARPFMAQSRAEDALNPKEGGKPLANQPLAQGLASPAFFGPDRFVGWATPAEGSDEIFPPTQNAEKDKASTADPLLQPVVLGNRPPETPPKPTVHIWKVEDSSSVAVKEMDEGGFVGEADLGASDMKEKELNESSTAKAAESRQEENIGLKAPLSAAVEKKVVTEEGASAYSHSPFPVSPEEEKNGENKPIVSNPEASGEEGSIERWELFQAEGGDRLFFRKDESDKGEGRMTFRPATTPEGKDERRVLANGLIDEPEKKTDRVKKEGGESPSEILSPAEKKPALSFEPPGVQGANRSLDRGKETPVQGLAFLESKEASDPQGQRPYPKEESLMPPSPETLPHPPEGKGPLRTQESGFPYLLTIQRSLEKIIKQDRPWTIRQSDSSSLEIVLEPEGLGKVDVELNLIQDRLQGQILVQDAAGKEMIEKNLPLLLNELAREGLQIGEFMVSLKNRGRQDWPQEGTSGESDPSRPVAEPILTHPLPSDHRVDIVV